MRSIYRRWKLAGILRRAARDLQARLESRYFGIKIRARWGAIHLDANLGSLYVVPLTETEAENLRKGGRSVEEGRLSLKNAGYPAESIPFIHFPLVSQEVIDRDYGGSWARVTEEP
jgi:hypothetical protein